MANNVIIEGRGVVGYFQRVPEVKGNILNFCEPLAERTPPHIPADKIATGQVMSVRRLVFEKLEYGDFLVYPGSAAEDFILGASEAAHRSIGFVRTFGKHEAGAPAVTMFSIQKVNGRWYLLDPFVTPARKLFPIFESPMDAGKSDCMLDYIRHERRDVSLKCPKG